MKYALILCFGLVMAGCTGVDTAPRLLPVPVGDRGVLCFRLLPSWIHTVRGPSLGPTVEFNAARGGDFVVLITAIPNLNDSFRDEKDLERAVRAEGESMLPTALQDDVELVRVAGPQHVGFLYHLTDRKPESGPGDYRELHRGTVRMSTVILSITILTHTGDAGTLDAAIHLLEAVTLLPEKSPDCAGS